MKKIVCFTLSFSIILSILTFTTSAYSKFDFIDIDYKSWYGYSVTDCALNRFMKGRGNNIFSPNDYITREEAVVAIVRTKIIVETFYNPVYKSFLIPSGFDDDQFFSEILLYEEHPFKDVVKGSWYEPYIAYAYNFDLINGINHDEFGVGRLITRQDFILALGRNLNEELRVSESRINNYIDLEDISAYAYKDVRRLLGTYSYGYFKDGHSVTYGDWFLINGILENDGKRYFFPKSLISRAEVAQFLINYRNMISHIY